MTTITALSLGQAARLAGVGKTTIARAVRSGRLAATRTDTGSYLIEIGELERLYPLRAPGDTGATDDATGGAVHQATIKATTAALAGEVASLREMLAMMREQLDDVRHDRDRWRDQAERLALAPPKPVAKPLTLWQWLRTPPGVTG
jgi:excisionase family DNA binding protein